MTPPQIETDRLILCALERPHFEAHRITMSDARVTARIGTGQPQSRMETWRRFCQFAAFWPLLGYGFWAITERAGGTMIGTGGLGDFERGIDALEGVPELGYALNAEWWGRGLASEAVAAMMLWSDTVLAATIVRAVVAQDHTASVRVLEKTGFAPIHTSDTELLVLSRTRA